MSKMTIAIEESTLKLDWWQIFECLSVEDKREMVRQVMLFDNAIFGEIIEAILTEEYASPTYNDHIFKARERMLERIPEMARDVFAKMHRSAQHNYDWARKHVMYSTRLQVEWPRACPHCEQPLGILVPQMGLKAEPTPPTPTEKIDQLLAACGVLMPEKEAQEDQIGLTL